MSDSNRLLKLSYLVESHSLQTNSFEDLISFTKSSFKSLPQDIQMLYIDKDNDEITISGQSDLDSFIQCYSDSQDIPPIVIRQFEEDEGEEEEDEVEVEVEEEESKVEDKKDIQVINKQFKRDACPKVSAEIAQRLMDLENGWHQALRALEDQENHFQARFQQMDMLLSDSKVLNKLNSIIDSRIQSIVPTEEPSKIPLKDNQINVDPAQIKQLQHQIELVDAQPVIQEQIGDAKLVEKVDEDVIIVADTGVNPQEKRINDQIAEVQIPIEPVAVIPGDEKEQQINNIGSEVIEGEGNRDELEAEIQSEAGVQSYVEVMKNHSDRFAKLSEIQDVDELKQAFQVLAVKLLEQLETVRDLQIEAIALQSSRILIAQEKQLAEDELKLAVEEENNKPAEIGSKEEEEEELKEGNINEQKENLELENKNDLVDELKGKVNLSDSEVSGVIEEEQARIADENLRKLTEKLRKQQQQEEEEINRILKEKEQEAARLNNEIIENLYKNFSQDVIDKAHKVAELTGENPNLYLKFVYAHLNKSPEELFGMLFQPKIREEFFQNQ